MSQRQQKVSKIHRALNACHGLAICCLLVATVGHAEVVVRDDAGHDVRLKVPAGRIVSLSPHTTELLFAAGAGPKIVGTVEYSDYPPAAKKIPRVGSYVNFDLERVLASHPDLLVVWGSGNGNALARFGSLGIPIYVSEPRALDEIADTLERLGRLAGTSKEGNAAARTFGNHLTRLRASYAQRSPVTVFYQIWRGPLFTLGGPHIFSRVAELCGGRNIFADLNVLAPTVDVESVLARDPEAIVASGMGEERPDWLDDWRRWPQLRAVRDHHLFFIPPDLLQRPTPRLLDGAERLCMALEKVRKERGQ